MFSSSLVIAYPEMLSVAVDDLAGPGSAMAGSNAAAAGPTGGVVPAAAEEVFLLAAAQFATHPGYYQSVSTVSTAASSMLVSAL